MDPETKPKVSKEFYELCYRQYEFEIKETNQMYQKASFVLAFLSILGTLVYNLAKIDILNLIFRVDIFLYYLYYLYSLSIFIACLFLGISVYFGILFLMPRKNKYKFIASMKLWQKWYNDYDQYLKSSGSKSEKLDDALFQEITEKLAEAQANNAPINEKRRQYFQLCALMAAVTIIPIGIPAMLYLYLLFKLQGV